MAILDRLNLSISGKAKAELLAVLASRSVDAVGTLVFLKVMTVVAAKHDIGTYLLASSFIALVLTASCSALDQGLLRNLSEYRDRLELTSRFTATLFSYSGFILILCAFLAGVLTVVRFDGDLNELLPALVPWLLCESLKNLNQIVSNGLRSRVLIFAATSMDYGSRILLMLWCYRFLGVDSSALIGVLTLASMLALVVYLIGNRRLIGGFTVGAVRSTLSDSLIFSWPMIIWGVFGWMQNMSNRWLLSFFGEVQLVAEYGVLVAIASFPITVLQGLVVTYIQPILYERHGASGDSVRLTVRRIAVALWVSFLMMALVASLLHREIISFFSTGDYAGHSFLLPYLMVAVGTSAACSVLTYAVFAQRRLRSLLLANTGPGFIGLVAGYFAVQNFQLEGAIAALMLSHLVAAGLYWIAFRRTSASTI